MSQWQPFTFEKLLSRCFVMNWTPEKFTSLLKDWICFCYCPCHCLRTFKFISLEWSCGTIIFFSFKTWIEGNISWSHFMGSNLLAFLLLIWESFFWAALMMSYTDVILILIRKLQILLPSHFCIVNVKSLIWLVHTGVVVLYVMQLLKCLIQRWNGYPIGKRKTMKWDFMLDNFWAVNYEHNV